jgi:hypothetical protein
VMRRVLEGGVGCESGGMVERSMDIFGERLPREEGRDESGVLSRDILQYNTSKCRITCAGGEYW